MAGTELAKTNSGHRTRFIIYIGHLDPEEVHGYIGNTGRHDQKGKLTWLGHIL